MANLTTKWFMKKKPLKTEIMWTVFSYGKSIIYKSINTVFHTKSMLSLYLCLLIDIHMHVFSVNL